MTQLIIIRHGESTTNLDAGIIAGQSNEAGLTDLGIEQAKILGKRLGVDLQPDLVVSSIAMRAKRTAEIALGTALWDVDLVLDHRVVEQGHGEWEGKQRAKHFTKETYKEFIAGHGKAPGGESIDDVQERAREFLASLEDHGGTVVVFTHGVFTKVLLKDIIGWDNQKLVTSSMSNTGITEVRRERHGEDTIWRLYRYNDHAHLDS